MKKALLTLILTAYSLVGMAQQATELDPKFLKLARYANQTAIGAAIPAPTQGMMVYNNATQSILTYNGSAWVNAANVPNPLTITSTGATAITGETNANDESGLLGISTAQSLAIGVKGLIPKRNQEEGYAIYGQNNSSMGGVGVYGSHTGTGWGGHFVGTNALKATGYTELGGHVKVNGEIKPNGNAGMAGQVLTSKGDGTMSWGDKDRFKNFRTYRNNGSSALTEYTFTVDANTNEVAFEIWGAGGRGSEDCSGASGAYIYAVVPTTTHKTFTLRVGGGGGCTGCVAGSRRGNHSQVFITSASSILNLLATSGECAPTNVNGTFSATGTLLSQVSYFGVEGKSSNMPEAEIFSGPATISEPLGSWHAVYRKAPGADAPFRPGTGGSSGYVLHFVPQGTIPQRYVFGSSGSEPGGGGGFYGGKGGNGQIIVYW